MRKSCVFLFVFLLFVSTGCADNSVTISSVQDGAEGDTQTADTASEEEVTDVVPVTKDAGSPVEADTSEVSPGETDSQVGMRTDCGMDEPCDDGNPCTTDDACSEEGVCIGIPVNCDDGQACTVDSCAADGSCRHGVESGSCLIEGVCVGAGDISGENPCLACQPAASINGWSFGDGLDCDDGDACSQGDRCAEGTCVGNPLICSDDNPCTDDICDPVEGCSHTATSAPCEDGDPCTLGDTCEAGVCLTGPTQVNCDDGNSCTGDTCSAEGCLHENIEAACEDGNPCTANDVCQDGTCIGGEPADLGCEDNNPCTDEGCDPLTGCIYIANTLPCDDGNACSVGDGCQESQCLPGLDDLDCDDGNLCTTDYCEKVGGCVSTNNDFDCDDGNACSTLDGCTNGLCAGTVPLECDDGNLCTDSGCDSATGCVFSPNQNPCDDDSLCTTDDICGGGGCGGTPVPCDDGNVCTADACDGETGGCTFTGIVSQECLADLSITSPARGASVQAGVGESVVVEGVYSTPAGGPASLLFEHYGAGGVIQTVDLIATGAVSDQGFSVAMVPEFGLNQVKVTLIDDVGASASRMHSFFYSPEWLADETGLKEDGLMILLGPEVIDDGDRSLPVDDLGTVFELVAAGIDLQSLLAGGQKLASQNVLGTTVDVYAKSISYSGPFLSLNSKDGALSVTLVLTNIKVDLSLLYDLCFPLFGCSEQEITGDAKASSISVVTDLVMSIDPETGELTAGASGTNATVASNFDVSLNGFLGGLLDFILGFFNNQFANDLASTIESQVDGLLPPLFSSAFSSLELSEVFTFPPLFGGDSFVDVVFESFLSDLEFFVEGARAGMASTANAVEPLPKSNIGSIQRANCLSSVQDDVPFFQGDDFGIGLHDDVFNRLLHAVWMGGGLEFPVDPAILGELDLSDLGIEDLDVTIEFLAAPVVSGCTEDGSLEIQIGDMAVYTSLTFGVIPLVVDIYVSVRAEAEFTVVDDDGVQELGLSVNEVTYLETDLVFEDLTQSAFEDALVTLIEGELVPNFLGTLTEGAIGGIPLPAIDLSGIEGVPPGVVLELDLNAIERVGGHSVLLGGVQ